MPLPVAIESAHLRSLGFRHGFATRALDFRFPGPERDERAQVLGLLLRYDARRLFQASQVHGATVLDAEGTPAAMAPKEADAIVATAADDAVGVRVADCIPLLLADPISGAVAAVHAGWRGVVAGVVTAALEHGRERGAQFRVAAIGPCIESCCFEVGPDVAAQISDAAGIDVTARRTETKSYIDLRRAVRAQLARAGVAEIDDVGGCTRCADEIWFSHRRDGDRAGRQLAVIVAGRR